jgi:hypothetical protein
MDGRELVQQVTAKNRGPAEKGAGDRLYKRWSIIVLIKGE